MKKKKLALNALVILALTILATASFFYYSAFARKKTKKTELIDETFVEKSFEDVSVDRKAKRKSIVALVERAKKYLEQHSLEDSCSAFSHTKQFVDGELYIFLFDMKGVCFAHPQEELLWQNLIELRDTFGAPVIKEIIDKASEGGGWITYQWRNTTKVSWVQKIVNDGKSFAIGAGYYPHSKEDAVVSIVKGAAALFDKVKERGQPPVEAFSDLSYPLGKFVFGDLYLYALDFKGTLMAQGDRPQLIGTNSWGYKDPTGKLVNQEIINGLKESDEGIWVEYISKRAPKRAYAEKVEDIDGNFYAIVCGYYPETTRKAAKNLVRKGYTYMKQSGKSVAAEDFTDKRNKDYRFGDLFLVVYDLEGKCVAHGGNPELVNSNRYDAQDEDGRYYIREMIEKAVEVGRGWSTFKKNKSFQSVYFEKIELGIDTFVIGSGLYPISKKETVDLLVKTGKSLFKTGKRKEVLAEFVKRDGKFISGDLDLFVFDSLGICYAYGDEHDLIWRNLLHLKDDDGKPFVKQFINATKRGPAKVSYKLNGHIKIAQLDTVEKGGKRYTIGCDFYL